MGLDVDEFARPGWHRRWRDLTGISLITKFPYSSYQSVGGLRDYLRSLEIEQMEADFQALSMLRLRGASCNGIVYWPLNKGGPLFGFGCVDYAGRPLMAYYAVRRLFADVVIGLYRDVEDVRVVGSNLSGRTVEGVLSLAHLDAAGRTLGTWDVPVALVPGNSVRLHTVDRLMAGVRDRTSEMVHATLTANGQVVRGDSLYFCPLAEYTAEPGRLTVDTARVSEASWQLSIESDRVARLVEIEASGRVLCGDNYFSLVPGVRKVAHVEALEPGIEPVRLVVSAWDRAVVKEITLE
jgi:beta-mannosidase